MPKNPWSGSVLPPPKFPGVAMDGILPIDWLIGMLALFGLQVCTPSSQSLVFAFWPCRTPSQERHSNKQRHERGGVGRR
jgi:hypothetical protein